MCHNKPQQSGDVVGPVVGKHHQKEAGRYENYAAEFHLRELCLCEKVVQEKEEESSSLAYKALERLMSTQTKSQQNPAEKLFALLKLSSTHCKIKHPGLQREEKETLNGENILVP